MYAHDDRFPSLVRLRLSAAIARSAAEHPVVVLTAPTGYGKTTAIRDYVTASYERVARIDVAAERASLDGFARALGAAFGIDGVEPHVIPVLLGERAERLPPAVVLDDLGAAAGDARIVELVESAIRRTRDRCVWLVATRDAVTLPLSRWCANGFVDEPIDERELRFDSADAEALSSAWGIPADDELDRLLEATDGWPLALARGLIARRTGDSLDEVLSATRERMHRFFAERVIATSSLAERRFYMETCVFDELTPDVLEAFGPGSSETMARVRATTSFVHCGADGTFRYHPAFRDFLRAELRVEGPSACERATDRALRTLAATGRDAECIRLAMRGEAHTLVETLRARGGGSLDRGEFALLRDAIATLPATVRETDPDVMSLLARVGGNEIPAGFEAAYERMLANEISPTRRAELALGLGARFARTGRGDAAVALLECIDPAGVDHEPTRARLLAASATLAARLRGASGMSRRIDEALVLAERAPHDVLGGAIVHRDAAEVALADERAEDALRFAGFAIDAAVRAGAPRIELRAHAVRYRAVLELGRHDNARAHLATIRSQAALADDLEMSLFALAVASDVAADAGDEVWLDDLDAALEAAGSTALETYVESLGARLGDAVVRSRALRRAWDGRFAEALRDLDGVSGAVPRRRVTAAEAAVYAAAVGDVGRAGGECARVRASLEEVRNPAAPGAVLARLLVAVASILVGDDAAFLSDVDALEAIADRLTLPHICFLRVLRAMHDYAGNRASRRAMHDEVAAMATHGLGGYAGLLAVLPLRATAVVPASVLTAGELRVLDLLCDGLTSREIAARLGRSVLTIDSHVKAIVKKLRCTGGRREAVTMARAGRIAGMPARVNSLVG